MIIDPLTGRKVNSKCRLEFNPVTMRFVELGRGEKFIRVPLQPEKVVVGCKLLFDPLQLKYCTHSNKLAYDSLEAKYVSLKRGEKLRFNYKRAKYIVVKNKRG